jgi:hypothetical protein
MAPGSYPREGTGLFKANSKISLTPSKDIALVPLFLKISFIFVIHVTAFLAAAY